MVYLCRDIKGDAVAVKWLNEVTPSLARRFNLEVESLRSLDHPNIVGFVDHGVCQERPFLVMEYVNGPDLRRFATKLHQRPALERYRRCCAIGRSIAEALHCIHHHHLIHRDIKPSNILVDSNDRVLVTDFGVVRHAQQQLQTVVGQVIGTTGYAAPEQLLGDLVDARADLFGLGATLYYIATLRRPFEGLSRAVVNVAPHPSRFDPNIPEDLEQIIMRLLSPLPRDRYASAKDVSAALSKGGMSGALVAGRSEALAMMTACLERVQSGEVVIVRPEGVPGTSREWVVDTLIHGACRRGIEVWTPHRGEHVLRQHLIEDRPVLGVIPVGDRVPESVPVTLIHVAPLSIAEVRRTLVASAPRTVRPSQMAQRLYRLTGGLPKLMVPLLSEYTEDDQFELPAVITEPPVVLDYIGELDLDELDVLAVLVAMDGPVSSSVVESIANVPAREILSDLCRRGLVRSQDDRWVFVAELFAEAVLARIPDLAGLKTRIKLLLSNRVKQTSEYIDEGVIDRCLIIDKMGLAGDLAGALHQARLLVSLTHFEGTPESEIASLCALGQALLDVGLAGEASACLADATALAKANRLYEQRILSHVLRARADLDHLPIRRGAAVAIDRLLPLTIGKRRSSQHAAQVYSTWARAAAALGDSHSYRRAKEMTVARLQSDTTSAQRVWLALAQAAAAIGELEEAILICERLCTQQELSFLCWEAARIVAGIRIQPPPSFSPIALGLEPNELIALKRRRCVVLSAT